jgi:hypothetical protein
MLCAAVPLPHFQHAAVCLQGMPGRRTSHSASTLKAQTSGHKLSACCSCKDAIQTLCMRLWLSHGCLTAAAAAGTGTLWLTSAQALWQVADSWMRQSSTLPSSWLACYTSALTRLLPAMHSCEMSFCCCVVACVLAAAEFGHPYTGASLCNCALQLRATACW